MGRKPTITREGLLEIAEGIVRSEGAAGLTIDALARAAGISKGGVQYSFSSKDDLVRALIERWTHQFDELLGEMDDVPPANLVRKYIKVMRSSQAAMNAKMAGLMIAYIQNPQNVMETRQWYRSMFERLGGGASEAQAARVALLAVEGLFLLRIAGIDEDGEWSTFLDDVESVFERLLEKK
ncbi:TetR family transcriptional regulator [Skermanella aerolata]|uniref:TetR family transcriptional regulator n=1 Tax=Skermanella aerolata TaxID=393310 RepID=A0A512DRP0_9PROT|nr:TetR/AcrR family transcriptional regulator [Skermanella aerolata]KJB93192.1 TetR family transcriptional regulator [Skermanella aerolata KACC 11604]GEO39159.1 TetR family transcriptional regulator [Skermanella aerolata]